nr:retrotransposon protein, putative, Ty3-gypsy subclass [Tanacetum cinerariifolium]
SGQQGYWASLRIEPDLISRIKEAQKEDSEIWTIVENLDKQVEFRIDDNVLWQDTRLVVPNDVSLREALLTEAHSSPFSVHPGSTKMYHDLKQYFWRSGMKGDVATFVARCLICQQVKIEYQRASGLLQQLDIPVWKWDEISMDFVTGLPPTQRRHDAIWVVVDRLTKSAHFLPIRKDFSVSYPDVVFSGQGDRETALANSAKKFIQEFELMTDIILNGSPHCTFRSQLEAYDVAWCSYLNSFVIWKVKDVESLEKDLVRAACQMEISMMRKYKPTPKANDIALANDVKSLQKQVLLFALR